MLLGYRSCGHDGGGGGRESFEGEGVIKYTEMGMFGKEEKVCVLLHPQL